MKLEYISPATGYLCWRSWQPVLFGDRVIVLEMMDGAVWAGREGKRETHRILKGLEEGEKGRWGKEADLL